MNTISSRSFKQILTLSIMLLNASSAFAGDCPKEEVTFTQKKWGMWQGGETKIEFCKGRRMECSPRHFGTTGSPNGKNDRGETIKDWCSDSVNGYILRGDMFTVGGSNSTITCKCKDRFAGSTTLSPTKNQ